MKRTLFSAITAAMLVVLTALPALAAPRADAITLSCSGEQLAAELFSYGNPIRVVDTGQNYIPRSVSIADPVTGDPVVIKDHKGEGRDLTTCSFEVSGLHFTMTGFFTGE